MQIKNFELKAKTLCPETLREILVNLSADYKGCDHQIDTYFKVDSGRLKLRQGNIENSLIFYNRENTKTAKESDISFSKVTTDSENILDVLTNALSILKVVSKTRHIYFIKHVKFHIDFLEGLGSFVEIEVIDKNNEYSIEEMKSLCLYYQNQLGISESDLIDRSYSDMVL
jgi:predicted adenylyl cyclase CyaB